MWDVSLCRSWSRASTGWARTTFSWGRRGASWELSWKLAPLKKLLWRKRWWRSKLMPTPQRLRSGPSWWVDDLVNYLHDWGQISSGNKQLFIVYEKFPLQWERIRDEFGGFVMCDSYNTIVSSGIVVAFLLLTWGGGIFQALDLRKVTNLTLFCALVQYLSGYSTSSATFSFVCRLPVKPKWQQWGPCYNQGTKLLPSRPQLWSRPPVCAPLLVFGGWLWVEFSNYEFIIKIQNIIFC